ncbi:MAG: phage minor capsid protein [Clostridia bacterium]|nr:phage minor capsid protein [Clostridia bacterium]
MADISKLEQQADLLMQNVSGWETSTLERIGKRIKRYGKLSLADVKSINNIAVVKQDMDAITKELAKVTGYNISQIEQMYGELLEEQHLANQPLYDYRGKKFVPFKDNRELQAIARAYAKTTGETMINLAKTKALCILDHNGKVKGLQRAYTDVLDKAVMQVSTGATDFHTAMRDSIIELGGSGVRVDYGGGVTRRLDTVVRQNLLWGAKQASVEYNEMIGEELGCDGYEVDWHSNPRPSHEFMQGKQFVVGKARTINGVHFDSFDEANERLQDYGCLHYKTPIICGISEPRYSPEELKRLNEQNAKRYTIDGKEYSGYDITQSQRKIESAVREQKTIRNLARASGDKMLVKKCNDKIKAYRKKYDEIAEITGISPDLKRMSVSKA